MAINFKKGLIIWLTGLSASGKSTIAQRLHREFCRQGILSFVLDGDKVRDGLCSDLGFSAEDRCENIRRVSEVAKLFKEAGITVIVAFISPFREDRNRARAKVGKEEFIEVYVECPLEICEERDPKGLYAKARQGKIDQFTGISSSYEEPLHPEICLKTHEMNIEKCTEKVLSFLGLKYTISQESLATGHTAYLEKKRSERIC